MTDEDGLQPEEREAAVYRPARDGGLERAPRRPGDYRDQLRSRRWNAAPLENREAERTDPRAAVLAIAILCVLTFVVIVLGYTSGFWS